MADTMLHMELVKADILTPGQLMIGDLIGIDEDIVEVLEVVDHENGSDFYIDYQNEFGEVDRIVAEYDELISLYVFIEPLQRRRDVALHVPDMSELSN